ncbi:aminotransferase class V-fold PLP-dependent enzyme [Thalassotalea sp. PLHSN55]|uniref:aminotransferase class V-fold PLP-dependent enzyme n=1 Tax=Thalassotalea sp. PLHSN55 TaxID=3435888 RepID=UPI003F83D8FB
MKTFEHLSVKQHRHYFLSHSVGLPFKGAKENFDHTFFDTWQNNLEPWPKWLAVIDNFRQQLTKLLNSNLDQLCPQTNLSSALTKVLFSLPKPNATKSVILYSQADFPSMAFVLQQAQSLGYQLKSIPLAADLVNIETWQRYIQDDVALAFISHVQSNNGLKLPVDKITTLCKHQKVTSIVDVAQSIGVQPIDVKTWQADFIIGSSVKWLCGGSGAGFLWVDQQQLAQCQPVDVGWFSHQNPFEFDGDHFQYHQSALRFWGGTPSVAPFAIAAFAIEQINLLGVEAINGINRAHQKRIRAAVNDEFIVSPEKLSHSSGTLILHFKDKHQSMIERLKEVNIGFDHREQGMRLSPHFYTTDNEVDYLINQLSKQLR